jgi:DNA-binding CsgD family transcriptional regulator/PAS domain-containing protein
MTVELPPEDRPSADFVAEVFEAAVSEDGWQRISQVVARETGVDHAGVWLVEGGQIVEMSLTRRMADTQAPYVAYFHKLDPWARGVMAAPLDVVTLGSEIVSERELVRSEFYNDFARRVGLFRPIGARIGVGADATASVAIDRPDSATLFEAEDKRRLAVLVPYLKRALQLKRRFDGGRPHAQLKTAALDAMAFGAVIADGAGRVLFANAAAEALGDGSSGVLLGGRRRGLAAVGREDAPRLAALIRDAAGGGPGGAMRVTGPGGGAGLLVLVTPLPRPLGGDGPGHALVALRPAADEPAFAEASLSLLFGLSPAQAAIARRLCLGRSVEEIAAERGVEISTMRTHLAQIFLRTGAENQRDLVRLLANLPPLRG